MRDVFIYQMRPVLHHIFKGLHCAWHTFVSLHHGPINTVWVSVWQGKAQGADRGTVCCCDSAHIVLLMCGISLSGLVPQAWWGCTVKVQHVRVLMYMCVCVCVFLSAVPVMVPHTWSRSSSIGRPTPAPSCPPTPLPITLQVRFNEGLRDLFNEL